jgi:hypothetical protein
MSAKKAPIMIQVPPQSRRCQSSIHYTRARPAPGGEGPRKNGGSTPCTSSHPRKNDIASCAPLGAICVPSARFSRSSSRAGLISLSCGAHLSSAAQTMVYFHLDASSLC